jgi:hypothetical protein
VVPDHIRRLLDQLPESALVLDVGGWAEPDPRADWVIDIGSYETRNWYSTLGRQIDSGQERFTRETWVERDVCDPEPWPFADGMFDFVICTQTLEDLRDPIRVCAEMSRVADAGYAETPSAATELTRGVESPFWCGWKHHRWLVWSRDGGLVFLAKPHHIHSPLWPSIPTPKRLRGDAAAPAGLHWEGALPAREEVLVDQADLDTLLGAIVAESSDSDRVAEARRWAAGRGWSAYRRVRSAAGGARRALRSAGAK